MKRIFSAIFLSMSLLSANTLSAQERISVADPITLSCSEGAVVDAAQYLHSTICNITFPADAKQMLMLDLGADGDMEYDFRERILVGYSSRNGGKIYFAMFSDNLDLQKAAIGKAVSADREKTILRLPSGKEVANIQISVSHKSISQAKKFLKEECIGRGIGTLKNNSRKMYDNIFSGITTARDMSAQNKLNAVVWKSLTEIGEGTDDMTHLQGAIEGKDYCVWDTLVTHFRSVKVKTNHISESGFNELWQLTGLSPDVKKKQFYLKSPILEQVEIRLGNGKTIKIVRKCEEENVRKATFNGKKVRKWRIKDKKLRKGGIVLLAD